MFVLNTNSYNVSLLGRPFILVAARPYELFPAILPPLATTVILLFKKIAMPLATYSWLIYSFFPHLDR